MSANQIDLDKCLELFKSNCFNFQLTATSVSSGPAPPAYPYGISGYTPVNYNPVPIYQSPLYYPKQGWGGKDKQDWAEWAKEQ